MKTAPDVGRLLTISEVRQTLSCGRDKIYQLRNRGELEFVKLDSRTKITERSVKRYLKELVKNHTIGTKKNDAT